MLLVTHAEDGSVSVEQAHSAWPGPVGLFVDHRLEGEIHEKIGENLPPGSTGIIAVFREGQRLGIEQALGGALIRSVVKGDKAGWAAALKESLAEAMHKFEPDRTQLPIPDQEFGGTAARIFDESVADWSTIPENEAS